MPRPRKLSPRAERDITLAYLCGVPAKTIEDEYAISSVTTRKIVHLRSGAWEDRLVETYRTSPSRHTNAAHLLLTFDGKYAEPLEIVDTSVDDKAYELVCATLYEPRIQHLAQRTGLACYIDPKHPYNHLISAVLGTQQEANTLIKQTLLETLEQCYEPSLPLLLGTIFANLQNVIVDKVRAGGISWTPVKKRLLQKTLEALPPRQQEIIELHYGLSGRPHTLAEIAAQYGISSARIRQLECKGLQLLRNHSEALGIFATLATDIDVQNHYDVLNFKKDQLA